MATPRKTASSESGSEEASAKKAPARRSAAKKAPAKKASAKKAPAKKSAAGKPPTKKPAEETPSGSGEERSSGSRGRSAEDKPAKKVPALKVARAAAQQLAQLTGRVPECVVGVQRAEEGWEVDLEVVESRRIPDSTDILAIYRVETDDDGDLTGYQRIRRYVRGKGGDGGDR